MELRLVSETAACLAEYGRVPIAFEVMERVVTDGCDGASEERALRTRRIARPFVKDYDQLPGQRPTDWARRWDLSKWWFAAAYLEDSRVGGAAVVMETSEMASGQGASWSGDDVALLWDIRVHPNRRRQGVGRRLLEFAEAHARALGRRRMAVETQDVNVPACRFYARAGYALLETTPLAYPELPAETRLIWRKDLA